MSPKDIRDASAGVSGAIDDCGKMGQVSLAGDVAHGAKETELQPQVDHK
jgi:hypothetical protein